MRKSFLSCILGLVISMTALSQSAKGYELEREMPVFLNQLKKELTYPMAWGNSSIKEFNRWQNEARTIVFDAMLTPPPYTPDYHTEVLSEEQRYGYSAKKIQFNLSEYSRVNAYLLVPDGEGPFPAIVLLHDHGGHYSIGKEKMIRPFDVHSSVLEDANEWTNKYYGGQYVGDYLASHGYIVISIDAIFWGERGRKEGIDGDKHMWIAGHFQMLGRSWSGFISYEDIYTTDYLATLPKVDTNRIGCMGFSMGGYRTWMLAALSDKIKAGAAICWMVTTDIQLSWEYGNENGGFANTLPGLRRYLDYPHIASIACPKPMFFINGRFDKLFATEGVEDAFSIMRNVWKSQNANDKLKTELWDIPHNCGKEVQESVLHFFELNL